MVDQKEVPGDAERHVGGQHVRDGHNGQSVNQHDRPGDWPADDEHESDDSQELGDVVLPFGSPPRDFLAVWKNNAEKPVLGWALS